MRKFKNISFDDSTGATKWNPDTCGCIIIYDKDSKYLDDENKCNFHQALNGQALLNAVTAHNRTFNLKYGRDPTSSQRQQMGKDKRAEKTRIRNL